ncbi:52 kDa repressor of the inhibitor of the protein kinase-like [Aphis craccivora]|uniref:52 kDa repressor of the inhibitor of the protein kinase-like n=1 Tax=Aphis craccivora TaxID=307492 RepID=A0A6G0XM26_APHCR|nr:52 kDa repressor of the inhibitor of the protein kinase-like [Aphis craccivora]
MARINHNCEISNATALSEATEPISSALDSPITIQHKIINGTSNISPQKDLSKPIHSKYDIGLYVNYIDSLQNEKKNISILNNVWTPDPNFIFPTQSYAKFKRQFQIKWLNTFNWLAYSKCKEGAFCKFCVLFLNQNQVGKGSHESLGGLVTKPYTNLKKALETFRCRAKELVVLREDFLTFVLVHDVTGHGLATVLLNTLKELGLELDKLRGQGYDGAATMSVNFRVKNSYPKALYTHCVSHSLNLCLSDASKTQAIQILPYAQSFKLKSLCETRWVLRHEAVMLFKEFLEPIVAALEQI